MERKKEYARLIKNEKGQVMMTADNGYQIPVIIASSEFKRPVLQDSPLTYCEDILASYPSDGPPAIVKIKDHAGRDKYIVNPMIPHMLRTSREELWPEMQKLLDDYHETLLKHPEIAAYISAKGEGNKLPDLCPPFKNMNLNSAPSSDIASISG